MTTLATVEKGRLGALVPISDGGQGLIFRVQTAQQASDGGSVRLVYKQYKAEALHGLDVSALEDLAALRDTLPSAERKRLVTRTAFPLSLVKDHGKVIGFTMVEVPDQFFHHMNFSMGADRALGEVQHLLQSDTVLAARGLAVTDRLRLEFLLDVCETVQFFHEHGIIVGDFSAKNLLFRLNGKSRCFFLDCDSMILAGKSAVPLVETPAWEVPAGERPGTASSDLYKLGLLAARLFAGDQMTRDPDHAARLNQTLKRLVRSELADNPSARVAAAGWVTPIRKAIAAAPNIQPTPRQTASPAQPTTTRIPAAMRTPHPQPIVPPVVPPQPAASAAAPKAASARKPTSSPRRGVTIAAAAAMALAILTVGSMAWSILAGQTKADTSAQNPVIAQADAISEILAESSHSRSILAIGVSAVGHCNSRSGTSTLSKVMHERSRELTGALALDVSALPHGPALKAALIAALRRSMSADRDFLNWSRRVSASGCGTEIGSNYYSAGVAESKRANAAKNQFVNLWNPIALQQGLAHTTEIHI